MVKEVLPFFWKEGCSASTDGWAESSSQVQYYGVTLHFISGWSMTSRLCFAEPFPADLAATAENVHNFVVNVLE